MHLKETGRRDRKDSIANCKKQSVSDVVMTLSRDPEPMELSPIHRLPTKPIRNLSTGGSSIESSPTLLTHKDFSIEQTRFDNSFIKLKNKSTDLPKGISEKHRAAILDWIIEVMAVYNQSNVTFFRCANLIDSYYSKFSHDSSNEIHLTGAATILLASKFDNVNYIRMSTLQEHICQNKFTKEQLSNRETEVVMANGFRLSKPVEPELLDCSLALLPIEKQEKAFLRNSAMMLLRMCVFSQNIKLEFSSAEVTGLSLFLSIKIAEQVKQDLKNLNLTEEVSKRFLLAGPLLFEKLQTLHQFTVDFQKVVPNAKNLGKYHSFSKTF